MGDLAPTGTAPKQGGMGVGSEAKKCNMSDRKSHTRFWLVPNSMTLDNLELPKRHRCRKKFYWVHQANFRPILSAAKCRLMIIVSRNTLRYMRIFAGVPSMRGHQVQCLVQTLNIIFEFADIAYLFCRHTSLREWVSSFLTAHQHIRGHSVP